MTKLLQMLLLGLCFMCASCDRTPREQKPEANSRGERVEWVDPNKIHPGPIQREALSEEQMKRIRALQATFADVDGQTVEQWVDSFKRDMDPDRELRVWERMAKAYRGFCDGKKLSPEAKKDVYRVVLLRSMASEQEVLERAKLRELTSEEAIAVMKGY